MPHAVPSEAYSRVQHLVHAVDDGPQRTSMWLEAEPDAEGFGPYKALAAAVLTALVRDASTAAAQDLAGTLRYLAWLSGNEEFAVWTDSLSLDSDQFVDALLHRLVAGSRLRLPRKRPQVTHGRPYRLTAAAQRLVDVLRRSRRPLGIAALMQACGVPPERSQAVRNHLSALTRHAIIRRAGHGLYAAQPTPHAEEAQAGE